MQPMIHRIAILCITCAAAGSTCAQAAELDDLLRLLPSDANTLVVINAEKAFGSQVAIEGKWKQEYESNFSSSPLLMPPDSKLFVMAARMDYDHMAPLWEVAAINVGGDPSIQQVARLTGGTIDEIAGMQTVATPRGMYLAKFGPHLFGARRPADRQAVARWLRETQRRKSASLSPYLTHAANYTQSVGTEIILAFDLADLLRRDSVNAAMQASPVVKRASLDPKQVADLLTGVQGVTIGVRVTKRIYGAFKIDFRDDAAVLSGIAKPLVLEILGEAGAMIEDVRDWKASVKGKTLTIEGELSRESLRKIFSFMELDSSGVDDAANNSTPNEETVPYVSKDYFDALDKYLTGLRREKGAVSIGQIGLWFEKYARKIDRLPTLNVDEELVDYGLWVSEQLRDATAAIQGIGIRSGARTARVAADATYRSGYVAGGYRLYGGGYGAMEWSTYNAQAEKRAVRAEERATGATQARQIMADVRKEQATMRRKMTDKFKIQF